MIEKVCIMYRNNILEVVLTSALCRELGVYILQGGAYVQSCVPGEGEET